MVRSKLPLAILASAVGLLSTHASSAQQPRLAVEPRQPSPGELVRLTLDRVASSTDTVVRVVGTMAGEPLHFVQASGGRLEALGAVPVDVSDSVVATVRLERASGAVDSTRLFLEYPHHPPPISEQPTRGGRRPKRPARLSVDRRFTQRMDSVTSARVEHENELARQAGRRAQDTPRLWSQPFLRPRSSKVTSQFGTGRVFNGRLSSSHLGIDYRGALGDPVVAANRGVVALVGAFFLAGNVIYINHGDGLLTGYFHLSKQEVAVGDTVERGQQIGLVGATGRVTGPHLHWSARFGALTVDPAGLLALSPPFVGPESRARAGAPGKR